MSIRRCPTPVSVSSYTKVRPHDMAENHLSFVMFFTFIIKQNHPGLALDAVLLHRPL